MKNKLRLLGASSVVLGSLLIAGTALAAAPSGSMHMGMWGGGKMPGVFGTVSAINGDTITLSSKGFGKNATPTTYSVDATNAVVVKDGATSTLASVSVGDMVMAAGTVSGSSVTATTIRDGMMMGRGGMGGANPKTPVITGNGQPVVGGTVTAINGSTLTITNKSNVTYTVDASSATIEMSGASSTLASVGVGDMVVVQGTVNGTSVTASSVIDSGAHAAAGSSASNTSHPGGMGGILGGIGNFFHNLFGFF